jgi:hypothetical protein
VGQFEVPADAVETAPAIYLGMGQLVGLPAVSQLVNGVADRVSFGLSGVSADLLALADAEAESVRGAAVLLGVMALGPDWQPLTTMKWIWQGEVDAVEGTMQEDRGEQVRTVSLSVGTAYTGRKRPRHGYYTDADQKRRSATDRFCERVSRYSQGSTRKWPDS